MNKIFICSLLIILNLNCSEGGAAAVLSNDDPFQSKPGLARDYAIRKAHDFFNDAATFFGNKSKFKLLEALYLLRKQKYLSYITNSIWKNSDFAKHPRLQKELNEYITMYKEVVMIFEHFEVANYWGKNKNEREKFKKFWLNVISGYWDNDTFIEELYCLLYNDYTKNRAPDHVISLSYMKDNDILPKPNELNLSFFLKKFDVDKLVH